MRTYRLLGLSPALLCIAAAPDSAPAQMAQTNATANAVQAAPTAVPASANEPKICKQLPTTGSRMPNRACLTKKQWELLNKQLEDEDR